MTSLLKKLFQVLGYMVLLLVLATCSGALAYLVGWRYLQEVLGGDFGNFFTHLHWLAQYWPRVPWWYPLEGGGVSLRQGYPILAHYLIITFSKLTSLSLLPATQLWGWLTVPVTAVGVGLLARRFVSNWAVSLMAALFYVAIPLSWVWMWDWGFVAEASAYVFAPWAILFFDKFLALNQSSLRRLWFVLAVVFYSLTILTHPLAGFGLAFLLGMLVLVRIKRHRLANNSASLLSVVALGLVSFLLSAWWLLPFQRYQSYASRDGIALSKKSLETVAPQVVSLSTFLSLKDPAYPDTDLPLRNMAVPIWLWVLSLVGVVLSSLRSKKVFWLGLLTWLYVLVVTQVRAQLWLVNNIPFYLRPFIARRGWLLVIRLLLPILAALGAWLAPLEVTKALVALFTFKPVREFFSNGPSAVNSGKGKVWSKVLRVGGYLFRVGPVSLAALVVAALAICHWHAQPRDNKFYWRLGPDHNFIDQRSLWEPIVDNCRQEEPDYLCRYASVEEKINVYQLRNLCTQHSLLRGIDIDQVAPICRGQPSERAVNEYLSGCNQGTYQPSDLCQHIFAKWHQQFTPPYWRREILTARSEDLLDQQSQEVLTNLEVSIPNSRYDLSPLLGEYLKTSQIATSLPRMQLYTWNLSLNHAFWGYQAGSFFSPDNQLYKDSDLVKNQSGYYGIDAVLLPMELDHLYPERYHPDQWQATASGDLQVLTKKYPTGLVDVDDRPRVLVIGSLKDRVYEQVFRVSNRGVLPYEQALLFEGPDKAVDNYSLEELQLFDALWLQGYSYKNRRAGETLLTDYVSGGGSLFIETGWQYKAADWEGTDLPDYLPSERLEWLAPLGPLENPSLTGLKIGSALQVLPQALMGVGGAEIGLSGPISPIFNTLERDGKPWGVSTFSKDQIKSNFVPLVVADQYVLVAQGQLGSGKVVWSGLNITTHAQDGAVINNQELAFLAQVWQELLGPSSAASYDHLVSWTRSSPDQVEFSIQGDIPAGTSLYWKENWWKDWTGYVRSPSVAKAMEGRSVSRDLSGSTFHSASGERLTLYRVGPGMMGIILPQLRSGDKVVIQYRWSIWHYLSLALSVTTGLGLLGYLLDGLLFRGRVADRIFSRVTGSLTQVTTAVSSWGKGTITGGDDDLDRDAGIA